ncbi:protein-L-isoaspartate O-methyltransferase [Roseibium aquae]|uniref:Protein-L-isoaspartate O-methyltransferase n=1 Tax=Roseibium aquae TaxID=1323746 RepID=A0A916TLL5_9HYPH|nr:protein-L-isoaspartate O-methyltransferase [Roseibium aquae]GGB54546.1 protein-L-isoaspartate O-methyltransferase [Roseibium aquae]
MTDYAQARTRMVDNQLRTNDVTDLRILDAMETIPREKFLPASKRAVAYIDEDLPIGGTGSGRYMLKPHVFGKMLQLARVDSQDIVLVVGAGTGYSAAVLGKLAASVVALEENPELGEAATAALLDLEIENAVIVDGPLTGGYASEGPYDVIIVNGAVDVLPDAVLAQLKNDGRLVVIEGQGGAGAARLYQNSDGKFSSRFGFNASAPMLPGFAKKPQFEF